MSFQPATLPRGLGLFRHCMQATLSRRGALQDSACECDRGVHGFRVVDGAILKREHQSA